MFFCFSLLWVLSITGLLIIIFRKKFGFMCTISFLLGSFFLYAFAYISKITWGFYLTWVFVALFWIVIAKWLIEKNKSKLIEFKNNFFSFGLFAFAVLCFYVFVRYRNQGFTYCDEFTHWGPMVVATLKCNGFYAKPESLLTFHKDYPPFFTLLEVLCCGFDKFNYSETYCYIALVTFMFSAFLPVFDKLDLRKKSNWFRFALILASIVLVGITLSRTFTAQEYAFVYNSIYTDWPLAVFTTYSLFVIYKEKEWGLFGYFFLTVSLSALFLMKQMGICFYLIVLFYAFIKLTFVDKKLTIKKLTIGILLFVLVPFGVYFSWQYIIKLYELQGQFVISELKFSEVLNISRGETEYLWKTEAYANFLYAIVYRPLILHPFSMPYVIYVPVIMLFMVLILRNKKDCLTIVPTYFIGACGYALTMLLLYMLAYDIKEAPGLASFDRYMSTYLYIGTTLTLMLAYDKFNEYINRKAIFTNGLTFVILCLLVEPGSVRTIIPKFKIDSEPMKVLVVHQYDGFEPTRENLNGLKYEFNDLGYVDEESMNFSKWEELLEESDLLYVVGYDDFIYNELWLPLNQETYLWNNNLYMINSENGKINIDYQMQEYYDYVMSYYLMEK